MHKLTDEDAGEEADSSATRVSADKYFDRNAVPLTSDKDSNYSVLGVLL